MATTDIIPPGFRFYKALIAEVAAGFNLPPALVAAVVWQESSFNADAFRFEQGFWNHYLKTLPEYATANPRRVSSSYGLMQVMYQTAKEHDYRGEPEALFDPRTALLAGCVVLRARFDRAAKFEVADPVREQAALASYNGGWGGNNPLKDSPLRNLSYAREVLRKKAIMEKLYARGNG